MSFVAIAVAGSALIGAGTAIYEGDQNRDALSQEQNLAQNVTYQPINIAQLQQQATQASISDAINSLALQRQLTPNVVTSNNELSASVAQQLAEGGNLPPDIASQVAAAGRTAGASSGTTGNAAPITSALIGQSALGLLQSRQQAATALSAANPAPSVGLSASDVASAVEANNNAENQFNLAKVGIQSNLINSGAQANAAETGGISSSLSQALGLLALTNGGSSGASTLGASSGTNAFSSGSASGFNGTLATPSASIPLSTSGSVIPGGN
jgi:hypothetical protein